MLTEVLTYNGRLSICQQYVAYDYYSNGDVILYPP